MINQKLEFCPILEEEDFLGLFPHRWDFISSPYTHGLSKVNWKTESRHTLSDRLIL